LKTKNWSTPVIREICEGSQRVVIADAIASLKTATPHSAAMSRFL
jgi:hypothetical protein